MGKKTGNFFLSLMPAVACITLQILVSMVVTAIYMAVRMIAAGPEGIGAMDELMQEVMTATSAPSVFCYHIVGIIVFGLWYYFGCGRPKPAPVKSLANVKFWGSGILAALVFISVNYIVINILDMISPEMIENYGEMWESMEMSNGTLVIITTVFLAPVGEEILMRGLIFYYARQCTKHFWVANVIQAFLFGLIHLNFVQGIYAFLGGLLLGWLYGKYRSLYIVILVHFLVNLSAGTWADYVYGQIPAGSPWWFAVLAGVLAVLFVLLAWNGVFQKRTNSGTRASKTV